MQIPTQSKLHTITILMATTKIIIMATIANIHNNNDTNNNSTNNNNANSKSNNINNMKLMNSNHER